MHTLRTTTASRTGASRSANQDRVASAARRVVLADGMGGRRGGERAAQVAVDTVLERRAGRLEDPRRAILRANARIRERAGAEGLSGMGTTVVVVDQPDPEATNVVVAWVGDSRLYRVRDGGAVLMTRDHTWEALLLELGTDPAEAAGRRHVLTRAVGTQPRVDVDLCTFEVRPGDRLVLCSDGVHGALDPSVIGGLAARGARALVEAAVAAGARDDATAAVVELVPVDTDADTGQLPILTPA
jgi:serine/threonine protein phosphatase PrpC